MEKKIDQLNEASISEFVNLFINQTAENVFLTGKAGTGKTTLLKRIVQETHKRSVIVAPTGIAALNAGGVTIHSFFQLPFGAFVPDFQLPFTPGNLKVETKSSLRKHFRMNAARQHLLRSLELLIVDEVSMLRADLLDAIDWQLRNVRNINQPFGGVQVLFIGDLLQLPPVIKGDEWMILKDYYTSIYFFSAQVLREKPPIRIELDKVYRQENAEFLGILNNLRNNQITTRDIDLLNAKVNPNFVPKRSENYITLTTHNADADKINQRELRDLKGASVYYKAEITGEFPEQLYPIEENLELKVDAQIMFIKNDISPEKNFYNGKTGTITRLDYNEIEVKLTDEEKVITVDKYEWSNIRYELNAKTGEIDEIVLGTFVQYPLKTAWAITVHKSQGLTFERAIMDIAKVFVPGQAYVALSRLRSLEGLVLLNPIASQGITNDPQVTEFNKERESLEDLIQKLDKGTSLYLNQMLEQAFDWLHLYAKWSTLALSFKNQGQKSIKAEHEAWANHQVQTLDLTLEDARRFRAQLRTLFDQEPLDLNHLYERVEAAYNYFFKSLDAVVYRTLKKIGELKQKKATKQLVDELFEMDELNTAVVLALKKAKIVMEMIRNGNPPTKELIWNAELRYYKIAKIALVQEELRRVTASLSFDGLVERVKIDVKRKPEKKEKGDTYKQTLTLIKGGKNIEQIAQERHLSESTIVAHCIKLIGQEKLNIREIMSDERYEELRDLFRKHAGNSIKQLKEKFGDVYSWDELKLYQASTII